MTTLADAILTTIFQSFLSALASAPTSPQDDPSPLVLASVIERISQEPPRNWGEEQRENFFYAIKVRYRTLNARMPSAVESAMYITELLDSPDSRLAKHVQHTGPRGTATLDACKEMLAGVETRDISYMQIANALLFMVIAQDGEAYDAGIFVEGLRQHRAGPKIDWTDVVTGFDKERLRITKKQFLGLYNALLPLAREYVNFDIQSLWSGLWTCQDAQLHFVVAFLSTSPEELDVTQVPNLRQAFKLEDYNDAPENVRAYAAEAVKHPLVSRDATEALFTMIFRSQETYNMAQVLSIPDTLINPNMTIFVCAASAVPKPWAALQEQALKQLFFPFLLKQHENYDFVMHSLWMHDKTWVAGRMVEFYQQDNMLLKYVYEHAIEHGWLDLLLTIQSNFVVDLATYAYGKGECDLVEWSHQHLANMAPQIFSQALVESLRTKLEDELAVQKKEQAAPLTPQLTLKTVHALLLVLADLVPDDQMGPLYRSCLQTYPRLFNYGENDERDAIIESNSQHGHHLPEEAGSQMEERYKSMYGNQTSPDHVVGELKTLKESDKQEDQEVFASMLQGLFDEYNCFGEYPNEALATTAVLFGGLVQYRVLSGVAEQAAIFMIFEAVSEFGPEDPMYRFGLQAMLHLLERLKEWPHLAERILHTPSLSGTRAMSTAETVLKELQQEQIGMNGDGVNGITNGTVDEEFPVDSPTPPFSAVHVDPPLRPEIYEDPVQEVTESVVFALNNLSKRNFDEKFGQVKEALEDRYHQWFAHYLVENLAKSQPNFQSLYLQLLESLNKKVLWQEVLRETYASCAKMLNAPSTMDPSATSERTSLKNLAEWLGQLTLARNQPVLHRNISFKDLLLEGHDTQRLLVALPFTCRVLAHAEHSKVFKPPNPWIMELLGILSEVYHFIEVKLNMKFEIENLCDKKLHVDIQRIAPLEIIRGRPPMVDNSLLQQYIPDGGQDGFGDMHLMGLSKRAPNERFSAEAVIQQLPDLGGMLTIPQAAGNITQPQLRTIFVNAAQQAIYEIIAPVVERSVTIAAISTAELIQKDFAVEADNEKVRDSAHTFVKALSGSLALVTCKEPLRMSIMNNIRILASRSLPEQLPEGQIIMFVNDNIDGVCGLVEHAAEQHSLAEIDAQLAPATEERRRHNEQRPNEPYNNPPVSRWAQIIQDPFRLDPNGGNASGLNRQQLGLYEEFQRNIRLPGAHTNNVSQDPVRGLPDVLADPYLPSLTTPAGEPAVPRQTPQQQRMQAIQPPQGQHQVNGYLDGPNIGQRTLELMTELQQVSREAPEEHVSEITEGTPIRRVYAQLIVLIDGAVQKDSLAIAAGQQCFMVIYGDAQKRLEIEVFVRLLHQLCQMSLVAGRHLTMYLASAEDDKLFNAAVTVALLHEHMLDVQHIDVQASKALKAKREVVLGFLKDLLDEIVLGDNSIALRSDFVLTYEALSYWLAEDSQNESAREVMSRLQLQPSQQNGMPSPPQHDKQDQLEYIFEEWIKMQRKDVSEKSHLAFVAQLHDEHVISEPNEAMAFFRACLEMSSAEFDRVTGAPYANQDTAYINIDALAKLITALVTYQSPANGKESPNKAKSLDAVLRLIVLVMNDHQNKQRERWNPRVYFRLFSSLLCELNASTALLAGQELEVYVVFATALQVLQPQYFPGFTYHWLALVGHRLLAPALLGTGGRTNGGWETYTKLLCTLFANMGELLAHAETPPITQDFYRGVLRFLLMMHHDWPDFIIENHLLLNSSIPPQCAQLHNVVNSAVSRTLIADQPDPFTPGLKINRLDQVRQAPVVSVHPVKFLAEGGISQAVERICQGIDQSEESYSAIVTAIVGLQGVAQRTLANAFIVYLGVQATAASSVFSSAGAPARLMERLLRESRAPIRYQIISAMMNQVRYVNSHTHYFSTALQHMFTIGGPDVREQIMRSIVERLLVPRPHPWGLIVMILEFVKNPTYDIWSMPIMETAPQVKSMMMNLAHSQDRMPRSPLGGMM